MAVLLWPWTAHYLEGRWRLQVKVSYKEGGFDPRVCKINMRNRKVYWAGIKENQDTSSTRTWRQWKNRKDISTLHAMMVDIFKACPCGSAKDCGVWPSVNKTRNNRSNVLAWEPAP